MYDCKQLQTKLLCDICEHRFKTQGEDWVIDCTCQKDGGFPLRDLLLQNRPIGQVGQPPKASVYYGDKIPELRHSELIYFAASVFWRGWTYDWSQVSADVPHVVLPSRLGPEFQDFLLGRASLPASVILQVEVALNPVFSSGNIGMIFPSRIVPRIHNVGLSDVGYSFLVFGMTFLLYFDLGKHAGLRTKALSIAVPPHPIFLTDVRMSEADEGRNRLDATAKRVGRLAHSSTGK